MLTLTNQQPTFSEETTRRLLAAEGWTFLGVHQWALDELMQITEPEPSLAQRTHVMLLTIRVLLHLKKWKKAQKLAEAGMKLSKETPEDEFIVQNLFALFKLNWNKKAKQVMRNTPEWLLRTGIVHYNLACYLMKLAGERKLSSQYMRKAIEINSAIRKNARKDPDLAELWT